jgi:hypothetical protein
MKTAISGILIAGMSIGCSLAAARTVSTPSMEGPAAVRAAPSAAGGPTGPASQGGAHAQVGGRTTVPVVVLVPANDEGKRDQNPRDGCWVRLMDNVDKVKGNETMTIFGSKYMPSLKTASGEDWARKTDGINIGPEALVTVFDEPGYRGHGIILRPNQVVQDLRKDLGFVNAIESMKVDCRA